LYSHPHGWDENEITLFIYENAIKKEKKGGGLLEI
jgi:hypothetical protein